MSENGQRKIQVAMCANSLGINGISTVILNYCSNMDLAKFEITILAGTPVENIYKNFCDRIGIHILELPERQTSSRSYYLALNNVLSKSKFDIFHIHGNSATITIELLIAKLNGINIRIAHSHNTTCINMKMHKLLSPLFHLTYTHAFACGKAAGNWLFAGKSFYVIPNGFYTENFKYQDTLRKIIRKKIQVVDKYVIGHIGRFNEQKNQPFLLDIFQYIAVKRRDAYLLLVGTGPDFKKTMALVNQHPYKDRIIVYGESQQPAAMYAAMDVLVFPSRYEGLPVVLLEAQINGLPCVVSDVVTKEVVLDNRIKMLSLQDDYEVWSNAVLSTEQIDRKRFYNDHIQEIERYQIQKDVKILENLYMEFCSQY